MKKYLLYNILIMEMSGNTYYNDSLLKDIFDKQDSYIQNLMEKDEDNRLRIESLEDMFEKINEALLMQGTDIQLMDESFNEDINSLEDNLKKLEVAKSSEHAVILNNIRDNYNSLTKKINNLGEYIDKNFATSGKTFNLYQEINCKLQSYALSCEVESKFLTIFTKLSNCASKEFAEESLRDIENRLNSAYMKRNEIMAQINTLAGEINKCAKTWEVDKKIENSSTSSTNYINNIKNNIENRFIKNEQNIKTLQSRLTSINDLLNEKIKAYDKNFSANKTTLESFKTELNTLKNSIDVIGKQIGIVEGSTTDVVGGIVNNITNLSANTKDNSDNIVQLKSKDIAIEEDIKKLYQDTGELENRIHEAITLVNNVRDDVENKKIVGIKRTIDDKLHVIHSDGTTSDNPLDASLDDFVKNNAIDVEGGIVSYDKYKALLTKVGELTGIHSVDVFYGDAFYDETNSKTLFLNKHMADVVDEHSFMFEINEGSYIKFAMPKKYSLSTVEDTLGQDITFQFTKLTTTFSKNGVVYNIWVSEEGENAGENIYTVRFTED